MNSGDHSLSTGSSKQIISTLYSHISQCKKAKKHIPVHEPIDFANFDPPNYHYITPSIQKYISSLKKVGRVYNLYFGGGRVIKLHIIFPSYKLAPRSSTRSIHPLNTTHRIQRTGRKKTRKIAPRNKHTRMRQSYKNTDRIFNRVFTSISTILSMFVKEKGSLPFSSITLRKIRSSPTLFAPAILSFPDCSTELSIYLYLTDLKKTLPTDNPLHREIKEENVNTGYTFGCSLKNQIFIYREEEWEKVLTHELIHAFGLDFASNNHLNALANHRAMSFFGIHGGAGIDKDLRLYEAYTETWANVLYTLLKTSSLKTAVSRLRIQQEWAMRQYVKIMAFYRLKLGDSTISVFKENESGIILKESVTLYSYYILKSRILFNLGYFFEFLTKTKDTTTFLSIIEFVKTEKGVGEFMDFIFNGLYRSDKGFESAVIRVSRHPTKTDKYTNSLRMTI
jgi:hypothetical protein